jgi:hypothetical protein
LAILEQTRACAISTRHSIVCSRPSSVVSLSTTFFGAPEDAISRTAFFGAQGAGVSGRRIGLRGRFQKRELSLRLLP